MSTDVKDVAPAVDVQAVLDLFDRLGDEAKRDALARLLRRFPDMEWPDLDDETRAQIADETFRQYDLEEEGGTA